MTTPAGCVTPDKIRYATGTLAAERAQARTALTGVTLTHYECPCGWWHLTARNFVGVGNPDATPGTVAALDDQEFAALTERDVRGWALPVEAAALADPINAGRWAEAVELVWKETKDALATYLGDHSGQRADWRARHLAFRTRVRSRRHAAGKAVAAAKDAKSRSYSEEALRARGLAGELAIDRLIRAHRAEFERYLAEECEKAGVELPLQVRRQIAIREATS